MTIETRTEHGPDSQWVGWSPARLDELFAPKSVALVGASERSRWAALVYGALQRGGYAGRIELVNGRGGEVFGAAAVPHLLDLDEPVDVAYVMVPQAHVLDAVRDAIAAGTHNGVVLSAGFAETGAAGAAVQDELVEMARRNDFAFVGPNTLGFINVNAGVTLHPHALGGLPHRGRVALVAQSGALNGAMLHYSDAHAIGLSKVVSLGNEAVVDVSDVMRYLAEDPDTGAIAVFIEAIRRPAAFLAALDHARARATPVVVLKVGRNELTARVAAAHTGAFVGDDSVIDAALRQHGAVRVDSLERMLTTASVLSRCDRPLGSRLVVVGISGGACDIAADRAADEGLELVPLADETVSALRAELPDFGHVQNPLDVTGAAISDPPLFGRIIAILGKDPGADTVLVQQDIPLSNSGAVDSFRGTLAAAAALEQPAFVTGSLSAPVIADDERFPTGRDRVIAGGLDMALFALGRGAWLARRVAPAHPPTEPVDAWTAVPSTAAGTGVWSEARSRALLSEHGVPMVPAAHVGSRDEAVAAASRLGYPVALKANADDLAHKTDVGAVELDVADHAAVRAALDRIDAALVPRGRRTDGYLVSPMRRQGTELIVGVARHDPWGLALAVGIGGVLTETHADASLRLLPVTGDDVREMLGELRHQAVLQGGRGRPPADLDAVVDAVLAVADAAWRRRDQIEAIEVNPLLVDGARVEALDALVEWRVSPDANGPR